MLFCPITALNKQINIDYNHITTLSTMIKPLIHLDAKRRVSMSLFYTFFKLSFKDNFTYRLGFYLSIFSSFLILFVQINVWQALYNQNESINNISLNQMLAYLLASTILYAMTRSHAVNKVGGKIENGSIISDMIKPINFKQYIFSEDIGDNAFRFIFTVLPVVIIAYFMYDVSFSSSITYIFLTLISILLAIILAFYINFILALTVFWLESSWYIPFVISATFILFSGSQIPIWFYPDWLAQMTLFLPFRYIIFEPISVFMSQYTIIQSWNVILIQCAWLAALYILERVVWTLVKQKVIIHGG